MNGIMALLAGVVLSRDHWITVRQTQKHLPGICWSLTFREVFSKGTVQFMRHMYQIDTRLCCLT